MACFKHLGRGLVMLLLVTQSACSIYSLPGGEPAPVEDRPDHTSAPPPTPARPPVRPAEPAAPAPWEPLLARADQASAQGDYDQALALLERAQRIDPDNGRVYLELARTHHAKGDFPQARATAERGLLYCVDKMQCDALRAYAR